MELKWHQFWHLHQKVGFNEEKTIIGTTTYVTNDETANFKDLIQKIANIPIVSVDPDLKNSRHFWLESIF